jgi:hypothetical protein
VDPAPERRQQADPPVAQLVAEPFDHHPPVGRQGAGRLLLVVEVREQVGGGPFVEVVRLTEERGGRRPAPLSTREVHLDLADEGAHRPAQLHRPAHRVALPERQLAGHAGRGADGHPVVADLLDPPAARAEHDYVAMHPCAQLVDHLLVQLPDTAAGRSRPHRP